LPDVQVPEQEKNYILHVSLPINDFTVLMGSDTTEQFCAPNSAPFSKGTNHYISINLEAHEADEAQRLFTALSANGHIEMALDTYILGCFIWRFHRSVWYSLDGELPTQ
jgi:PhnB protein